MSIFEQFGSFFGGGNEQTPGTNEPSKEDRLKELEERKRQIVAWSRSGERAPADVTELANLERQIAELKGETEREAA